MRISLPYHRSCLQAEIPDERVLAVLTPEKPIANAISQEHWVEDALTHPIASPPLHILAGNAARVLILSSDHTRPVPSKILMPLLLREIRKGNPHAKIIILVAAGCHRPSTQEELVEKYGAQIAANERIVIHDSTEDEDMTDKGMLPSGGRLRLNRLVDWADLLIGEGFIEPHFFAGFSGGRKSVLPGIASRDTVLHNHCAAFIANPKARTGILEGNPIHDDMVFAARAANLKFILNVSLDENKQITGAWAGDFLKAHEAGCSHVLHHAKVPAVKGDIVITSNGGYPLDQNIYQAVKCMTAAEACVCDDGVIIVSAACHDGHGGHHFYRQSSQPLPPEEIYQQICALTAEETEPDQWQTQILMRVLSRARVIVVANPLMEEFIKMMHMTYAHSLEDALAIADSMKPGGKYVIIPDGVSVIIDSRQKI